MADGGVAIPAARERLGAVRRKTAVVHEPCAGEGLERRCDHRRRDRGTLQALGKSTLRQVPGAQRTGRHGECLLASNLPPQQPHGRTVEDPTLG